MGGRRSDEPESALDWRPPGWDEEHGGARYFVASTDGGYVGHLEVCAEQCEQEVRDFLVSWLERRTSTPRVGTKAEARCAFLSITLAAHGHCFEVACFSYGASPAPEDWPHVPLAHLLMFAALDLRGE